MNCILLGNRVAAWPLCFFLIREYHVPTSAIATRTITASETRALRARILRPGQPLETTVYPGDEARSTRHFGSFLGDELIGIASIYREAMPSDAITPDRAIEDDADWRLRGMAVAAEFRRSGAGRALYAACLNHVRAAQGRRLWFNARTSALAFYESLGAQCLGEEFDLPGIGPHRRMATMLRK